ERVQQPRMQPFGRRRGEKRLALLRVDEVRPGGRGTLPHLVQGLRTGAVEHEAQGVENRVARRRFYLWLCLWLSRSNRLIRFRGLALTARQIVTASLPFLHRPRWRSVRIPRLLRPLLDMTLLLWRFLGVSGVTRSERHGGAPPFLRVRPPS